MSGSDAFPSLVPCGCGNLLSTAVFRVGLYDVLPFPGVEFPGQEDGKRDLRIVLLFTCLTNNISKLCQRLMMLYIHKSL